MAGVERGVISSVEGDMARVTVPERSGYVTLPLLIPPHLRYQLGELAIYEDAPEDSFHVKEFKFEPGMRVAFVEFPDLDGFILARLEG